MDAQEQRQLQQWEIERKEALALEALTTGTNNLTLNPAGLLNEGGFLKSKDETNFETVVNAFTFIKSIPRKGMIFVGDVGTGKTLAIKSLFPFARLRRLTDVTELQWMMPTKDTNNDGEDYEVWRLGNKHNILDDVGNEQLKSIYGVKYDTVANFILQWHSDKFMDESETNRLFITTNMTVDQLNERYGKRILDRLFEMCVLVKFHGESKRITPVIFG